MFKLEHATLGFIIQQYAKGWAVSVDADAGCFYLEKEAE